MSVDEFAKPNKVQLFGTLGVNQAGIRWKEYVHNWGGHTDKGNQVVTTVSHRSTPSAKHLHYRDAIVFRSSQ
jgi:hypothetical protein